jgi:hypothetical protein
VTSYAHAVYARGEAAVVAEIDRLQRKICGAQRVVDHGSKASAILFLDEEQGQKWPSYQAWCDDLRRSLMNLAGIPPTSV